MRWKGRILMLSPVHVVRLMEHQWLHPKKFSLYLATSPHPVKPVKLIKNKLLEVNDQLRRAKLVLNHLKHLCLGGPGLRSETWKLLPAVGSQPKLRTKVQYNNLFQTFRILSHRPAWWITEKLPFTLEVDLPSVSSPLCAVTQASGPQSVVPDQQYQHYLGISFSIEVKFTLHQINHFKVYSSSSCSTFSVLCNYPPLPSSKTFSSFQKESLSPLSSYSLLPLPQPLATANHFLFLRICLFWTFHRNGVIQYVTFCVWLLSLSITFLRFIQVVACVSTSFLSTVLRTF